jgi:hypothetical protein
MLWSWLGSVQAPTAAHKAGLVAFLAGMGVILAEAPPMADGGQAALVRFPQKLMAFYLFDT